MHEVESLARELAAGQLEGPQAALLESAQQWLAALEPLGAALTGCFLDWLPKATYPVRYGVHQNSAFGLGRALPYAQERMAAGDGRLAEAIRAAARRWFATDKDYPAGREPSGSDFLSAALIEAELMTLLLPATSSRPGSPGSCLGLFPASLPLSSTRRSSRTRPMAISRTCTG